MAKSILIVDDDLGMLKMASAFLTGHGYSVTTAIDGEDGIAHVSKSIPDLIVLDIQMPKMNGYTFMFEMHKITKTRIPVIVLTAKEGMAEIFKIEGANEYLTKPLQPEVLLKFIKKYI